MGTVEGLARPAASTLSVTATEPTSQERCRGDTSFSFFTALAALLAFFAGCLVCGATNKWDRAERRCVPRGAAVGTGTVALLILSGISARALAGPLGGFLDSAGGINGIAAGPQRDAALEATQKSAAQALLSLALSLAASVAGAVPGSKLWPRRQHGDDLASNRVHGS